MKSFLLGLVLLCFSIPALAVYSYDEYAYAVAKYNNCLKEQNNYFSGGPAVICYKPDKFTGCINSNFSGGPSCIPIKIKSCAVYVEKSKSLYITDTDVILNGNRVLSIPYVKLKYSEKVGGFIVEPLE